VDIGAYEFPQPTVTLPRSAATLLDNGGTANVTATLSQISTQDVTVNLDFSDSAALSSDYMASDISIVIPAGQLSGFITLTGLPGSLNATTEPIVVDIASVSNAVEETPQQATVSILNVNLVGHWLVSLAE